MTRRFRTSRGGGAAWRECDATPLGGSAPRRDWAAASRGWAAARRGWGAPAMAAALLACFASPGAAANKNPPTIKDLDAQQVDVSAEPPQNIDANKTMD